jgi:hypothetical protein
MRSEISASTSAPVKSAEQVSITSPSRFRALFAWPSFGSLFVFWEVFPLSYGLDDVEQRVMLAYLLLSILISIGPSFNFKHRASRSCFGLPVWREADSDIGRSFPFCDSLGPAAGFRTRAQSGTRNSFRFRSTRFVARTPMIGKRGRVFRERSHNIGERLL